MSREHTRARISPHYWVVAVVLALLAAATFTFGTGQALVGNNLGAGAVAGTTSLSINGQTVETQTITLANYTLVADSFSVDLDGGGVDFIHVVAASGAGVGTDLTEAAGLQAQIRAIATFGSVAVISGAGPPNFVYTVIFYGKTGDQTMAVAVAVADAAGGNNTNVVAQVVAGAGTGDNRSATILSTGNVVLDVESEVGALATNSVVITLAGGGALNSATSGLTAATVALGNSTGGGLTLATQIQAFGAGTVGPITVSANATGFAAGINLSTVTITSIGTAALIAFDVENPNAANANASGVNAGGTLSVYALATDVLGTALPDATPASWSTDLGTFAVSGVTAGTSTVGDDSARGDANAVGTARTDAAGEASIQINAPSAASGASGTGTVTVTLAGLTATTSAVFFLSNVGEVTVALNVAGATGLATAAERTAVTGVGAVANNAGADTIVARVSVTDTAGNKRGGVAVTGTAVAALLGAVPFAQDVGGTLGGNVFADATTATHTATAAVGTGAGFGDAVARFEAPVAQTAGTYTVTFIVGTTQASGSFNVTGVQATASTTLVTDVSTLSPGETATLTYTGQDANGNALAAGYAPAVAATLGNALILTPAAAQVVVGNEGVMTLLVVASGGSANATANVNVITVTDAGGTVTVSLTNLPPGEAGAATQAGTVAVTAGATSLVVGEATTITATVTDADGAALAGALVQANAGVKVTSVSSGVKTTGADGTASFTFTGSEAGDRTVTVTVVSISGGLVIESAVSGSVDITVTAAVAATPATQDLVSGFQAWLVGDSTASVELTTPGGILWMWDSASSSWTFFALTSSGGAVPGSTDYALSLGSILFLG